jgi:beta-lactamase regulating signal transducer with metallopeptidase domain
MSPELNTLLAQVVNTAASLGLLLAVGATVALGAAWLGTLVLARATAATRFVVWAAALACVVMLAIGRVALAPLPLHSSLPWLSSLRAPAWNAIASDAPESNITATVDATNTSHGALRNRATRTPVPGASAGTVGGAEVRSADDDVPTTAADASMPSPSGWSRWVLPLVVVWLAGSLLVCVRLVRGTLAVRRMVRSAPRSLVGEHWRLLQHLSDAMGVQRPVSLRVVGDDQIPVTTGVLYPVIVLPRIALTWPTERLAIVMQHELAHVARCDVGLALAAQLAAVLCWWHPLVWHALRMLEREREHACDDFVLSHGVSPADYADELLQIVRALRTPAPVAFAALGMARPSQVESRVRAVLRPRRSRNRARRTVVVAAVALAAGATPVGSMVPVPDTAVRAGTSKTPESSASATSVSVMTYVTDSTGADSTRGAGRGTTPPSITPPPSGIPSVVSSGPPSVVAGGAPRGTQSVAQATGEFTLGAPCPRNDNGFSIGHSRSDSVEQYYRIDKSGCVRMYREGDVRLTENDLLDSLSGAHARLIIEYTDRRLTRRLTVQGPGGASAVTLEQNGERVDPSQGMAWARTLLQYAARDVGLDAERRVTHLVRDGDVDPLLRELREIRADDVIQRYYQLALADKRVRDAALARLVSAAEQYASTQTDSNVRRQLRAAIDAALAR